MSDAVLDQALARCRREGWRVRRTGTGDWKVWHDSTPALGHMMNRSELLQFAGISE